MSSSKSPRTQCTGRGEKNWVKNNFLKVYLFYFRYCFRTRLLDPFPTEAPIIYSENRLKNYNNQKKSFVKKNHGRNNLAL